MNSVNCLESLLPEIHKIVFWFSIVLHHRISNFEIDLNTFFAVELTVRENIFAL